MPTPRVLESLAQTWRLVVGSALRGALFALLFATVIAGARMARQGTPLWRAIGGCLIALGLLALLAFWWSERRRFRDTRRIIKAVLAPTDRALSDRSLRALALVERTAHDDTLGSSSLARLHFERMLERASPVLVQQVAERRARRWRLLAYGLLGGAALAFAFAPLQVVEGLNVLAARRGVAPLPMRWLDRVRVSAQSPSYLRQSDNDLYADFANQQPAGSVLSVRGYPRFEDRDLVLSDGDREVPFVSDGAGGLVARWTVKQDSQLRVAARFGKVLVYEPELLKVDAVLDHAPLVALEGAPRKIELKSAARIELRYVASDDHGLSQVDLVLRSGDREDRRTLAKLTDEASTYRGGHALEPRDPFLRRMFLPTVVTIEARDNDPIDGPKWGKSAAFVLLPSPLGEPEAERYAALAAAMDPIARLLAAQMRPAPSEAKQRVARKREEKDLGERAVRELRDALSSEHGLGLPAGLRAFIAGQARLLERGPRPGASALRNTEDVLLAIDAVLRGLSSRDARSVSKRLAEVADEAADGAKQARETERRDAGIGRLDAALIALSAGAEQMQRLGALGRDIGSVAVADLARVQRSRARDDLWHSELAARHLAERLRRPNPSFGAAGSGARPGGVESGGRPSGASMGEPSEADQRFNQLAGELQELASEHSGAIEQVSGELSRAEQAAELEHLRAEAKERAEDIRRNVSELPQFGADPGSARGSAALAREHASAMAQNLERLDLQGTVDSGRNALGALNAAENKARNAGSAMDWLEEDAAKAARQSLQKQLAWAEQRLAELKASADARSRSALNDASAREKSMAERAGNLAGRGRQGETALPEDVLQNLERAERAMQEAARELANGKGEEGLAQQRSAQRLLEQASTGRTDAEEEASNQQSPGGEGGREVRTDGDVPEEQKLEGAEEFRRRVLQGLAKSSGRLSPAVRRYAEGLLR